MNTVTAKMIALIVILKLFATWFAINIYAQYTKISDAAAYVSGALSSKDWSHRTFFVGNISHLTAQIFGDTWVYYIFSLFSSLGIFIVLQSAGRRHVKKIAPLFILPSTAIYTGIPGKESLASFGACLVIAWWFRFLRSRKTLSTIIILPIGICLLALIRPHYALAISYIVVMTLLWRPTVSFSSTPIKFYTLYRLTPGLFITGLVIGIASLWPFISDGISSVINVAIQYFPAGDGRADRHHWLSWRQVSDFWENLWWAIPFSVIGPLPSEVFARPIFFPFFLEGLFIIGLVTHSLFKNALTKNSGRRNYAIFVLGPALIFLLLVHAPFGTANPGSAIRYRAAIEWLLLVPVFALHIRPHSFDTFFRVQE